MHEQSGHSTGPRSLQQSLLRDLMLKYPACGVGALFRKYLKVADECTHCGEALHHHRTDDAPAYFTIGIVGHVVVSLVLAVEMAYRPALWIHAAPLAPADDRPGRLQCWRRSKGAWWDCSGLS